MLRETWTSTARRVYFRTMRTDYLEWRAITLALSDPDILGDDELRVLTALELHQQALRRVFSKSEAGQDDDVRLLVESLSQTPASVVRVMPKIGFAQLGVWAAWSSPVAKTIIGANLAQLQEWPEDVARIEAQLASS